MRCAVSLFLNTTTQNMERAANCIFGAATFFGLHLFYPREKLLFRYQIIPSLCILLVILSSNVYYVICDYWCLMRHEECARGSNTVTIICFSLLFKVVLSLQFILSFYCGILESKAKMDIFKCMEKVARVLNCSGKIIACAKKVNKKFLIAVWPGTLVILFLDLSYLDHLNYLNLYRELKGWFGNYIIFIWEWKYVFFASMQGNLFDQLNNQVEV